MHSSAEQRSASTVPSTTVLVCSKSKQSSNRMGRTHSPEQQLGCRFLEAQNQVSIRLPCVLLKDNPGKTQPRDRTTPDSEDKNDEISNLIIFGNVKLEIKWRKVHDRVCLYMPDLLILFRLCYNKFKAL